MSLTLHQRYQLIAHANNAEDFTSILHALIERLADIRQGSETLETRQAAVRVLQDALDSILRIQKNQGTRSD